jgi:hypothetical protein
VLRHANLLDRLRWQAVVLAKPADKVTGQECELGIPSWVEPVVR